MGEFVCGANCFSASKTAPVRSSVKEMGPAASTMLPTPSLQPIIPTVSSGFFLPRKINVDHLFFLINLLQLYPSHPSP